MTKDQQGNKRDNNRATDSIDSSQDGDDLKRRGNSTEDEQRRFIGQVRNSPQGKKRRDRSVPEASQPTDRPLGEIRQGDPDWNGEWNDQRLHPSAADTDLDSDIERGP